MTNTLNHNSFRGEIRVASRIIDYLSSGLYPSPAACLKELINNAFDADAFLVEVFVKPDADRIIITDNGIGMNRKEFEQHFQRISESHKRDSNDKTPSRRPKIGKIGIGFIAANELCEMMEVFSTKKGSTELLHVTINFEEMRKPIEERRRGDDEIVKADYEGEVLEAVSTEHYTHIFLTSPKNHTIKEKFVASFSESEKVKARSVYGLTPEKLELMLKEAALNSWKEFDLYSQTLLEVALNVPVQYFPHWMPAQHKAKVKDFEERVKALDFHLIYDGTELFKPIVFNPPSESVIVERFEYKGENVSAEGYFYVQHGTVKPLDLQGLLVRIRNAAVGEYDHSFWEFPQSDSPLIQRWVSAEIWASDELEDAMNIDRRTLRVTHPAYVELREALHRRLREVLKKATKEIYQANRTAREDVTKSLRNLTKRVIAKISPAAAVKLDDLIKRAESKASIRKALQKKYSITELFETVITAGNEVLSERQMAKLLERLTEQVEDERQKTSRD